MNFTDLMKQEQHEPIWVVNSTAADRRANVFFTVPNTTGSGFDNVTVFVTFVPQCLTESVTRKQLLDSSNFRRAVQKQLIKLITTAEAQELLNEPGAKQEAERVAMLDINSATSEAQFGLGPEAEEQKKQEEGVSIPVRQFAELMNTSTDMESLNTLRSMGELDIKSYRLVNRKAKEINYVLVSKYCASQIEKLKQQLGDD